MQREEKRRRKARGKSVANCDPFVLIVAWTDCERR